MSPLSTAARVQLWDRALHAVREYFARAGLAEVSTSVRLPAVALEPFIEPVRCEGGVLATSPELAMKMLLAHGSGSIYQVAPVFRAGEEGHRHREEFRLVEWYRVGDGGHEPVRADVEALVAAVHDAVPDGVPRVDAPTRWEAHGFFDIVKETTGLRLRGDEDAEALRAVVQEQRPDLWVEPPGQGAVRAERARALAAWTAFFSTWSDAELDRWLQARAGIGVHVVDFPVPLAALSVVGVPQVTSGEVAAGLGRRFESFVGGLELANGYEELRDAGEQRERFEAVAELRGALELRELPWPGEFLGALPRMPECSGAALGLERLVMAVTGARGIGDVGSG